MKKKLPASILILITILPVMALFGQQIERSKGDAQVRIENNMTKEQAREKANELAIVNAIENAFGTYVEQQTDILVKDGRDYYSIVGGTKVKGDWIETLDVRFSEDPRTVSGKDGNEVEIWITCTITGKVRKATPKALINYQTLNCPEIYCHTRDFHTDESLYLYFISPVDGYLSVFLEDETSVYRLFPYPGMSGKEFSAATVKADQAYLLFSKDADKNKFGSSAEEYLLYTTQLVEIDKLYVIFSEEPYLKPILSNEKKVTYHQDEILLPKSLSKEDFQAWLADNRAKNNSFLDANILIKIIPR